MGLMDSVKKLRDGLALLKDPKALLASDAGRAAKDEVDAYVEAKLQAARTLAGGLADETLQKARAEAAAFLDVIEKRIDLKLVEIEKLLEARLQREIYWKLVALRWTLAFVVLMALVSLLYLWMRQRLGAG
ncbi:MAG: hypothetical protein JNL90_03675 [Planctomycetes bacterium]|nr:hypothetical protein [Planctomycetota bacterium]